MSDILVDKKAWVKAEVINVAVVGAVLLSLCLVLPIAMQNVTSVWYKSYNQYLIGPVVNAALIYSALRFKKAHNGIGIVLLPSVCTAVLGLVGINAIFMMYMVPFIWLGNMAIFLSFRYLFRRLENSSIRYVISAVIGIGLKVALIFGGFLVLRSFDVFPTKVAENLFTMMGMVQIITATCGAVIAFGVIKSITLTKKLRKA